MTLNLAMELPELHDWLLSGGDEMDGCRVAVLYDKDTLDLLSVAVGEARKREISVWPLRCLPDIVDYAHLMKWPIIALLEQWERRWIAQLAGLEGHA
ncbi:MAG: hypothetical protein ABS98_17815 [Lysobacteraceae bacterium SCN 69-48]|nr:MAG: hypothetical protein ABS98_17815 [Xanthomonadaceae bacterium SCN 69-48]